MDSLVPSLYHLAGSRLIVSLFTHFEVQKEFPKRESSNRIYIYERIKSQVKEVLPHLTSCTRLQEKLEAFVDPLLLEMEDCLQFFGQISIEYCYRSSSFTVAEIIPRCWLSDGTIDREKMARFVAKNPNLDAVNQFIYACTFGLREALDLWNALLEIEKVYLRRNATAIVEQWIQWLESSSTKDWESFLAFSLDTPLACSNATFLKHALQTLSPAKRNRYLLNVLSGTKVDDDVMRFGISVMPKEEKDQIFRKSTTPVMNFISSWPLRPSVKRRLSDLQRIDENKRKNENDTEQSSQRLRRSLNFTFEELEEIVLS